jgi:putative DNA primase/helicase
LWMVTGNNAEPQGDTVRRSLVVRMEVLEDQPQSRTGFKYTLPDEGLTRRAELLSAALTILRGFHVAGRPDQSLPAWGSFTVWSSLVRGALVWAGAADPYLTQQRARA